MYTHGLPEVSQMLSAATRADISRIAARQLACVFVGSAFCNLSVPWQDPGVYVTDQY